MSVAVTGASGLIGTALVRSLRADGVPVVRLVRRAAGGPDEVSWDPARRRLDVSALERHDVTAIVNLSGANVGDHRWTAAYRREILDSRVDTTSTIAEAAASLPTRPVLVSGSAEGIYGDTGSGLVGESASPGSGFLAEVVVRWEAAADPARAAGLRVVHPRTGLVVSGSGGAWARLAPIVNAGLVGRIGSGKQWWSFISLTDEVRALRFLIDHDVSGAVNLVAPRPVTNADAIEALGDLLGRPTRLPVPNFALRIALGEFSTDITSSIGVLPGVLTEAGFTWQHPTIEQALAAEIRTDEVAPLSDAVAALALGQFGLRRSG